MKVEVAVAVVVVGGGGGEREEIVLGTFCLLFRRHKVLRQQKRKYIEKIKIKKEGKDVERRLRKKERGKERSDKENQFC
jgi:nicotinamide mononucleotide (NMN) deamidase PncC